MSDIDRPVPARLEVDPDLVRRLVAAQFPHWAGLPVRPVATSGWDNRTFHLGDEMLVRLPSATAYQDAVAKEQRWLSVLAPQLPLPIPIPLGRGEPGEGYPCPWSIYQWLDGTPAWGDAVGDLVLFAADLADFLNALRAADATGGPGPGRHNWFRGGPLTTYDRETRDSIVELADEIPAATATAIWEEALAATYDGPPVWFHGDVAQGNLLMREGRLAAVIDFGTSGVGDPSCDIVVAWTMLHGESRDEFRRRHRVDPATWSRGRGWALWKALITYAGARGTDPEGAAGSRYVLDQIFQEYR